MKKFVAILLALLLVLVNVAALADTPAPTLPDFGAVKNEDEPVAEAAAPSIKKTYTTTGTADDVYPTETLEFAVTPAVESYPTVTVGDGNTFEVNGTTDEYTIPVNVPAASAYGAVGRYHYTVQETGASTTSQAVTYDTDTVFNVDVYIIYKIVDGAVTNEFEQYIVIYSGDEKTDDITTKEDDFGNEYSVGSLKVTKEIAGNLADPSKEFSIKITLTSENNVASDIAISGTATLVSGETDKNWTSKVITFTAKGGEYILIEDIPTGVTYTIEETDITKLEDNTAATQMENANDDNAYYVEGEVSEATAIGTSAAEETITNTKEITVPTGIALDKLPYVLILAVAVMGAVMLVIRKREEY